MREIVVAKITDLQNGQMQQIEVEGSQILLSKIDDKFYATGAFCTHYGAPLAKGILCGEKIVCPWHNACFNAIAGQQIEPPGLDSLATFLTRVEGENVLVKLPQDIPQRRTLEMADYIPRSDERTFAILGAGAAGVNAAETLRKQGFQGNIVLIGKSAKLPYDRTKLSKAYLQGQAEADSLTLRDEDFYNQYGIELRLGKAVTKVDLLNKSLTFEDDSRLDFDSLLLATGGKARKLNIPGADLPNVFTIRKTEDVDPILDAISYGETTGQSTFEGNLQTTPTKNALVIGSSFIGMEAEASLLQHELKVTDVSTDKVTFQKIMGVWHQRYGIYWRWKRRICSLRKWLKNCC